MWRRALPLVAALLLGAACSAPRPPAEPAPAASPPAVPPSAAPPTTEPAPAETPPGETELRVRIEDRAGAGDFVATVHAVLAHARGWRRAGFRFVADPAGPYRIVLAEGPEVDRLCAPYDTAGRYSCQNGPVVALNADRWRSATPEWTGDLAAYRAMLVNHEVGHLLHLHHPRPQCPGPGLPAPVMAQQSTELGACLPNPWPLDWEIALAARRAEPLAPGAEHQPDDHRPAAPPARS